jgi:membrane-bound inhibitor of C-type lysozyme
MKHIAAALVLALGTLTISSVSAASMGAKYACTNGSKVQATYNGNKARLVLNGRVYLMTQALSASGVRYIGGGYTWWTKGDKADLYRGTNLNTMKSLDSCRER